MTGFLVFFWEKGGTSEGKRKRGEKKKKKGGGKLESGTKGKEAATSGTDPENLRNLGWRKEKKRSLYSDKKPCQKALIGTRQVAGAVTKGGNGTIGGSMREAPQTGEEDRSHEIPTSPCETPFKLK